ncbi:MAG: flagellar hook-basal body complex protein [Bacillota bacterium]|nr:flagellar hook-basal body complex protein [Bacillota bacterium]
MMRSMYSAVSGLRANQTAMDVIGNNIANVNTPAFKASRSIFADMFYQMLAGAAAPQGGVGGINSQQVGLGVRLASIDKLMTQGALQSTGVPTDLAIQGQGFFVLGDTASPPNLTYTRLGDFKLDAQGYLVDAESGKYVLGWRHGAQPGAPTTTNPTDRIQIVLGQSYTPPGLGSAYTFVDYNISADGTVNGIQPDGTITPIAHIALAVFPNPTGLDELGGGQYRASANSGVTGTNNPLYEVGGSGTAAGTVNSNALEMSNVDLAQEFTNMITTQRGFEANAKVITTADQMLQVLTNLKQ